MSFSASSADSSIIENAVFKYGGWDGGQECGVVESRTPTPTIKNCRFEKNVFPVAFTLGAQPELSGLKLASNDFNGLWLRPGLQLKSGTLNVTEVPYIFWSPDGRDFILPSSSSLSVTPGVVIKVGSRANLGSTTSLVLSGTVNISGTADKPVVLTSLKDDSIYGDTNGDGMSTTAQPGDWGRISLSNTSAAVEHCIIRYAGMDDAREFPAVECVDSSLDMKYSEISACVHAAWISRSTAVIANCTIACNLLDGLAISTNSTTLMKNSVISFNGGVGVRSDTPNTQVYYSNVYGNSSSDYLGIVPAEGCISVDPLFRDISLLDFRLMPGSACIDAGDPNEVDPGTDSRIDMGCWPYNTPTAP